MSSLDRHLTNPICIKNLPRNRLFSWTRFRSRFGATVFEKGWINFFARNTIELGARSPACRWINSCYPKVGSQKNRNTYLFTSVAFCSEEDSPLSWQRLFRNVTSGLARAE